MAVLDTVLATVQAEFSDLLDVEQVTRVALRMSVALLVGAAIGWLITAWPKCFIAAAWVKVPSGPR